MGEDGQSSAGTGKPVRAKRRLGPFFQKRECRLPTWRAWLVAAVIIFVLGWITLKSLYPFLAPTEPVNGGALVVEGWTSDYTLAAVAREFARGGYQRLYVVGGRIEHGAVLSEYGSFAERGAAILRSNGVASDMVIAVPAPDVPQDRTYTSFRALARWWEVHGSDDSHTPNPKPDHSAIPGGSGGVPDRIHLISEAAHGRRSRMLLEMALNNEAKVGITSVPPRAFDSRQWWKSSAGFRTVIGELIAYLYVRVLFRP